MFAQVYLVALLAFFARAAPSTSCARPYTVKVGDYCNKISQEQGVSTDQLFALNPAINQGCTNLQPGEIICLAISGGDVCSKPYVVQSGDTCNAIATKYALTLTMLRSNNPQLDELCDIFVGQVICVSKPSAIPSSDITGGSTSASISLHPTSTPSKAGAVVTGNHNTKSGSSTHTTPSTPTTPSAHATSLTSATVPTPSPTSKPAPSSTNTDEDNGQLPFCDEED